MRKLFLMPILLLAISLSGCPASTVPATPTSTAQVAVTKTLQAVGLALKATPQVLDALYAAGKITKDDYNQVAKAYNKTLAGYQLAISALNTAVASGQDPNTATAYLTALAAFTMDQNNLNNLMIALGGVK